MWRSTSLVAAVLLGAATEPVEARTNRPRQLQESEAVREAVDFIRGLKERRLFDLAQIFAAEQLDSESVSRLDRSGIVLEQMRTKAAEAVTLTGDQREAAWRDAIRYAEGFLASDPDHPRRLLIEVQVALTHLANGNLIRQEIAAEIAPESMKDAALQQYRLATDSYRRIEKEIEQILPERRQRAEPGEALTWNQLVNLKNNLRYQMAVVNLAKAGMYDASDRLNQLDAINQVLSRLEEVLQQSEIKLPLWWQAQLSRSECLRLMDRYDLASEAIENLPPAELTSELKSSLLEERLLIAVGRGEESQELLRQAANFDEPTAELQLAQLRLILLAASRNAGDEKSQWLRAAAELVDAIENRHGRYWGRRAEVLLVNNVEPDSTMGPAAGGSANILVRQGDSAFRKGNFADAIKAYDKALRVSEVANDAAEAVAITVRLAKCLEATHEHGLAADRLIEVAMRFSALPGAAAVHLRGCWNWARTVDKAVVRRQRFVELLQQQLSNWPDAEATATAKLWLGNYFAAEKQWERALVTWLSIPIEDPNMVEAVEHTRFGARQWIGDLDGQQANQNEARQRIAKFVKAKLDESNTMSKSLWNEAERELLLVLVEFGLPTAVIEPDASMEWIDAAIKSAPEGDSEWRARAATWRFVILASQQLRSGLAESERFKNELKQLPNDPAIMQICLDGLKQNLSADALAVSARLVLLICDKALAGGVSGEQQSRWMLEKSIAQIQLGHIETGVRTLSELAKQNPNVLDIQLEFVRGLTRISGQNADALNQWRQLAKKLKPGSEPWYESKYNIAKLLHESNQTVAARTLLEYLRTVPPGWDQSSWQPDLEALLEQLK